MYGTNIFRYWATENLTSVSAILDFKMAAAANRELAMFLDLSQLQSTSVKLVAKQTFSDQRN